MNTEIIANPEDIVTEEIVIADIPCIILIILQALGTFMGIINGDLAEMFTNVNGYKIGEIIGFFLIGIIGVILLLKAKNKENNSQTR